MQARTKVHVAATKWQLSSTLFALDFYFQELEGHIWLPMEIELRNSGESFCMVCFWLIIRKRHLGAIEDREIERKGNRVV